MPRTILLCTVGGSADPIVKAIEARRPDHVAFLCSDDVLWDDGATSPGSRHEVTKPGGIVERAGLAPDRYEIACVPHPDDPDGGYLVARDLLGRLRKRFPDAAIVADYTGGTKSMTAALMLAATAAHDPALTIQFVSGVRKDLVKVLAGTERPLDIAVDAINAERDLERAALAWRSYAYQEAETLLARYVADAAPRRGALPPALQDRITSVHQLSAGFAAWDRFEHQGALDTLSRYGDLAEIASRLNALRQLAENKTRKVQAHGGWRWLPTDNPLLPLDLWHNAQRRAHRQRYDDAIARCYRLVEATVQWVLYTELDGLDTFEVRRDQLGEELAAQLDRRGDGKPLKLGLEQALDVVRVRLPEHWLTLALGPKVLGARRSSKTPALTALLHWKEKRNQSILAHGFEPLGRDVWQEVERWVEEYLAPRLVAEARAACLSLPQLPNELPAL